MKKIANALWSAIYPQKNKDHDLAGNAQYWYGETFRIRQLYSDAATAFAS